jgi:hypothetical protein
MHTLSRAVRIAGYGTLLIATSLAAMGQPKNSPQCQISYENSNQTDYGPLELKLVSGTVVHGKQGAIAGVCVGIFGENDHELIASAVTDEHGSFAFPKIQPGSYRFVVIAEGLCPANVPLRLNARTRSNGVLQVVMKLRGIDDCSFGKLISPVKHSRKTMRTRSAGQDSA